ncbi:MAG: transcriptional regulator [Bacteroidetes bacterium]|jgi:ATP-dependent DNA helicase RecG|nr:transcriptional regulator [Bacteroidota bacterium]MBT6685904.1 transcriptional regulator [Bacteroidota bacterium]MBT7144022.1 transcriptional regulator [Bacteroidota bacterium]MBT7493189.1 transcriptional regulator [Bacteroidota bacterium]
MQEKQNIEWKESWRDEYLKWICGFANAQGGKIYIGKNDKGDFVGIDNAKKLLEDIPNKVRDILGILVDVNLHETEKGDFLEIVVEPQPFPVNYKGQYHYRSGSTKQELKGAALDKFMLEKKGKKWDGVPVPNISIDDLKNETFEFFKKRAIISKRIDESVLSEKNISILENLRLTEKPYLKRASILLFHPDPEKYFTGAFIKIGYFQTDTELIFQDEVKGNLFEQVEKTIEILFTKYIKAIISYEGIHRVETYEYPKDAVREAILNALAHKDYSMGVPIQISVYDNKLMIWNYGQLPEDWTVENLMQKHSSIPYNPDIANAFFRAGHVESWGRGTIKIIEQCEEHGLQKPEFENNGKDFWVIFRKDIYNETSLKQLGINERQIKAVLYTKENSRISNKEYQSINSVSKRTATNDLTELVDKFKILNKIGTSGAGIYYKLMGQ